MLRTLAFASVLVLGGCAGVDPIGTTQEAVSSGAVTQGTRLQGTRLQGTRLQGTRLQGTRLQGTRLQGTRLQGTSLAGFTLQMPAGDPSLDPCPEPTTGIGRDCGWQVGGIGTCAPGASVTVGTSAACGLGSCAGDSMIRVCSDQSACGPGSAAEIAENDNACGGTCSSATFTCPASGFYTVLVANQSSDDGSDITPAASTGSFPLTTPIAGADFIGATLEGIDGSGNSFDIHIDDIEVDPGDPSGEILLYTLSFLDTTTGAWENICDVDADGVAAAIPLAGLWDDSGAWTASSDLITIGCTVGVIAKCTRWGYKPWKTVNGHPLQDYHQSCTRMARADYCGDGTPHTRDGTLIDVWDNVPIQTRDPSLGMLFEASWNTAGAYCVSKGRWNLDGATIALECPARLAVPSLQDLLAGCLVKLTNQPRTSIRTNNDSYLELHL